MLLAEFVLLWVRLIPHNGINRYAELSSNKQLCERMQLVHGSASIKKETIKCNRPKM